MHLRTVALFIPALLCAQGNADWDKPFPAHKVAGNLYYVGTEGLSTYLITTPQGHILIDAGFERPVIKSRSPATRVATYAEGTAMIKELTGAKIIVMVGQGLVCCRLASLNRAPGVIANTE